MADNETQLLVSLEGRIDQFEKAFNRAGEIADKKLSQIEKRAKEAGERISEALGEGLESLERMGAAIGIGLGLKEIMEMADAFAVLQQRMSQAAGSAEKGAE